MKTLIFASVIALGCNLANPSAGSRTAPRSAKSVLAETLADMEGTDPLRPFSKVVHLACVTLSPYVSQNDRAILEGLQSGDLRTLEKLYRAYEGVIYTLGLRLCGARSDAEDIVQDTFIEVNRSAKHYRGQGSLAGWIKKICVNKALMKLRRSNRFAEETLEDEAGSLPSTLTAVQEGFSPPDLDMEQAFFRLGSTARVVVWLHDVEGYTHEEIAQLLGKTVSFSKSQLARAHERMRDWLGESPKDSACGI